MSDVASASVTLPLGFLNDLSKARGGAAVLSATVRWLPEILPALRASGAYVDGSDMFSFVHWADGRRDPITHGPGVGEGVGIRRYAAGAEFRMDRRSTQLTSVDLANSTEPKLQSLYAAGIRKLLMVPLVLGNGPAGLLTVGSDDPGGYSEAQGQVLRLVSKCIAAHLEALHQVRRNAHLAETDPLTGLANRARLMRLITRAGADLHRPDSDGCHLGLLHIDLDGFKEVNDRFGHGTGDALLEQVADTMRQVIGPKDLAARVGGDEFVVVTRTAPDGRALDSLGRALVHALGHPFDVDRTVIQIGASVGSAMATAPGLTATRLIANADLALYEAKRRGKGRVVRYTETLRAASSRRTKLISDLRTAAQTQAFTPVFQPRIALRSGRLLGFEALARWPHEAFGLLAPAAFLDLARDAHLLSVVDGTVRGKALVTLQRLRQEGWDVPWVSVNLSCQSLARPELAQTLLAELAALDLTAADLRLEVSESHLAKIGLEAARDALAALSAAGFAVELDDFGVGLASTAVLSRIDVRAIKLHETIVTELPNPRSELILKATLTLAKELGIETVAEGAETQEQLTRLAAIGCDAAHGFALSKALPQEDLTAFLDRMPIWTAAGGPQSIVA